MKHIIEALAEAPVMRALFLGSSDAPAAIGVSPWMSRLELWRRKVDPDFQEQPDIRRERLFRRGHLLEPFVIQMFEEETDLAVTRRNVRYTDPEHAFLSAELDGETADGAIVECKTVSTWAAREWGEPGSDEIPVHYTAQVMHQMMVAQRALCHVAALIGVDDFRCYRVERDEQLIAMMRRKELAFWQEHVMTRTPPPPATPADVAFLYGRDDGSRLEADDQTAAKVVDLKGHLDELHRLEVQCEREKLELQLAMQGASVLTHHGRPLVTWKAQSSNRFDAKAFAEVHPALYAEFKRASESRVFRVKG